MQLSSRSKLRKELCALWQVLFSFARCPASGQLGIVIQRKSLPAKQQYYGGVSYIKNHKLFGFLRLLWRLIANK